MGDRQCKISEFPGHFKEPEVKKRNSSQSIYISMIRDASETLVVQTIVL